MTRTPEQIAAERYPNADNKTLIEVVHERAAFLAGYREAERGAGVDSGPWIRVLRVWLAGVGGACEAEGLTEIAAEIDTILGRISKSDAPDPDGVRVSKEFRDWLRTLFEAIEEQYRLNGNSVAITNVWFDREDDYDPTAEIDAILGRTT
jgi:hypothetical protein